VLNERIIFLETPGLVSLRFPIVSKVVNLLIKNSISSLKEGRFSCEFSNFSFVSHSFTELLSNFEIIKEINIASQYFTFTPSDVKQFI
jgi:hypothetical protein